MRDQHATRCMQVFHGEKFAVSPEWQQDLAAAGIRPGLWQGFSAGAPVSASAAGSVYRLEVAGRSAVYVKLERIPPRRRFKWWFRPGKSAVEAFAYEHLQSIGVPTLTVVGFAERRTLGCLDCSMIVTAEIEDSVDLASYVSEQFAALPRAQQRTQYRAITRRLIEQLQLAHASGFIHHDMKWRNILLQRDGEDWLPVWIDAPRGAVWRWRRQRGQVIDLCDLAIPSLAITTCYDRMRFLCRYLGRARQRGEAKRLYLRVMARVQRRTMRRRTA